MEYVRLGRTGLQVSEISLGTMTFGNEADEATARALMDRAVDAGINFFDSAHNYNKGATEEIVGRWLGPRRHDIIVTTKVFFPRGGGINDEGCSRRNILFSIEKTLQRLKSDYVDIVYLHHWDELVPIEDSLGALHTLVEQGKALYVGVSNFSAWQTMKAIAEAKRHGYPPLVVTQPMYSLVKRQAEVEIFPLAAHEGLAVVPYNAIGAGLLTGKYLQEDASGRLTEVAMYKMRYEKPEYIEITKRFVHYAREHGHEPAALAVAWSLSHPLVDSAIVGARNMQQFESILGAASIRLSPEQRAEITALSIDPPLATDREPMDAMRQRGW